MENSKHQEYEEIFNDMVNSFIALHFAGMNYKSVIHFVETMLNKLKEDSKSLTTVKDILGR